MKRAQAARARAAPPSGRDDPAFAGTQVPAHLLERARRAASGIDPAKPVDRSTMERAIDYEAGLPMAGTGLPVAHFDPSLPITPFAEVPEWEDFDRITDGDPERVPIATRLLNPLRSLGNFVVDNAAVFSLLVLLLAIFALGVIAWLAEPDPAPAETRCSTKVVVEDDVTVKIVTCRS